MANLDAEHHGVVLAAVLAHRNEVEARRAVARHHGDALLETLYGRAANKLDAVVELLEAADEASQTQREEEQ